MGLYTPIAAPVAGSTWFASIPASWTRTSTVRGDAFRTGAGFGAGLGFGLGLGAGAGAVDVLDFAVVVVFVTVVLGFDVVVVVVDFRPAKTSVT